MAGVDLLRIGRMMGHSTVVTTQIYAHLLSSSLKEAMTYMPAFGSNGHQKNSPVKTITSDQNGLAKVNKMSECAVASPT
jgi:hypothetical protein